MLRRLNTLAPGGEALRYLLVGAWNTLFGYSCFALFTAALANTIPESYLAASLLSSLVSITVAFLGYKWFVFRTQGNYLREWLRCVAVYTGAMALNLVSLPVVVLLLRRYTPYAPHAPYLAGAIVTLATVAISFWGHKNISFRRQQQP